VFYSFNIIFIATSSPGGLYIKWLDENLNYIQHWRTFDLQTTANILNKYGYQVKVTDFSLSVYGYSGFKLAYSCLGYGIMSFYAAFVLVYPKGILSRMIMLGLGLLAIQALNLIRFSFISIYWKSTYTNSWINHHTVFNIIIYLLILLSLLWWTKTNNNANTYASNKFKEEFQ